MLNRVQDQRMTAVEFLIFIAVTLLFLMRDTDNVVAGRPRALLWLVYLFLCAGGVLYVAIR